MNNKELQNSVGCYLRCLEVVSPAPNKNHYILKNLYDEYGKDAVLIEIKHQLKIVNSEQ